MSDTITEYQLYRIKEYYHLDEGIKETYPELLQDRRVWELCFQLENARILLELELENKVRYEDE